MSSIIDTLFAYDRNQRYGIYAAIAALVIGSWYYFFYSPNAALIAQKTEQREDLERREQTLRRQVARYDQYQEEIKRLDLQLKLAVTKLPDQREIPELLATVSAVGRESGLEILLFRAKPENLKEFYAEVPVEMLVRGGYRQIAAFLERISKLNRVVNAVDISLKNPVVSDAGVQLDMACTAVTFRFLTDAERKAIEERKKNQR